MIQSSSDTLQEDGTVENEETGSEIEIESLIVEMVDIENETENETAEERAGAILAGSRGRIGIIGIEIVTPGTLETMAENDTVVWRLPDRLLRLFTPSAIIAQFNHNEVCLEEAMGIRERPKESLLTSGHLDPMTRRTCFLPECDTVDEMMTDDQVGRNIPMADLLTTVMMT